MSVSEVCDSAARYCLLSAQYHTDSNSLESRDLRVLEDGCESEHARHVFAEVGEVVLGQAASERELALRAISGVG